MKNKFRLWLNIVTICLCVCAIAIGVYAATNATLTVSGQIGFEAHGCEISIEGTLSGYVTGADSKEIQNNQPLTTVELNNDTKSMVISDESKPEETKYFTDLVGDEITPITLKLDITNKSKFKVRANVTVPQELTDNNMAINTDKTTFVIDENEGTGEVELLFTVINSNNDAQVTLSAIQNLKIEFVKFDGNYYDGEYYIEEGKLTVNMGHATSKDIPNGYQNVALPWIAFAVKGNYDGTTATAPTGLGLTDASSHIIVDNNTTEKTDDEVWYSLYGITMTLDKAKNHTFWFIQKYVTAGERVFNASIGDGNNYANTTEFPAVTSDIYDYIVGTNPADSYLVDIGVTTSGTLANDYYNSITPRIVNEKNPCASNSDQVCSFSASLWLVGNKEVEELLSGGAGWSCEEPVLAYRIGSTVRGSGNGAYWWTRSSSSWAGDGCVDTANHFGDWNYSRVDWAEDGIRAAFQISI